MNFMDHKTEISFGTYDNELMQQEITIPEGFEAIIEGDKIILKKIESEDKRIRKELIEYVKDQQSSFISAPDCRDKYEEEENNKYNSWLAWLEKQDESDETKAKIFLINKGYPIDTNGTFPTYEEMYNIIREGLENQDEQKSSDKEVPKFQEGDWVVYDKYNENDIDKIVKFDNDKVSFESGDWVYIKQLNEDFRLWTINDAKPGDVLAMSWREDDNSWEKIIIFKKYHNKGVKGLYNMPCVEGYGNTFRNGKLIINEEVPYYSKTWTVNLHPATKEQHELLFQKMHEAGYTFDFEKKEPKKLKFKVGDEVITKNEESLTITRIDEEGYWSEDLFICSFDDSDKWELVEPAWSDVDEYMLNETILHLKELIEIDKAHHLGCDVQYYQRDIDWLKLLKNRVVPQPKQEWSEDDENRMKKVMHILSLDGRINNEELKSIFDWLKLFKERYTWKPSDAQMEALKQAKTDACGKPYFNDLVSLYVNLQS